MHTLKQKATDASVKPAATTQERLEACSQGRLSHRDVIRRLGPRDLADLLAAFSDADLTMPLAPEKELDDKAATFVELWRHG